MLEEGKVPVICRRSLDRILYHSEMSRKNVAHMQICRMGSSGRRKVYGFSLNIRFPPSKVFFLERLFPKDFEAMLSSWGPVNRTSEDATVLSSSKRDSSLIFNRFDSVTSAGSSASRLRSLRRLGRKKLSQQRSNNPRVICRSIRLLNPLQDRNKEAT